MSQRSFLPPPGWYPDPDTGSGGLRWWDGGAWTAAVRPSAALAHPTMAATAAGVDLESAAVGPVIPAQAAWWALMGLVVGELVGGVLAGIVGSATGNTSSAAVTLVGELGLWGGMISSCVFVSRRYGSGSLRRDYTLGFRLSDLWKGVVIAVVGTVFSALASSLFAGSRFAGSNTQLITGQRNNGVGFAIVTVIVALGAPFFEELFFRGLLRTALAARLGQGRAVVAQGLLFGLAHFVPSNGWGNVAVVVTIAGLGIILGYAAMKTKRLGAGMVGHSLFNLITTLVLLT